MGRAGMVGKGPCRTDRAQDSPHRDLSAAAPSAFGWVISQGGGLSWAPRDAQEHPSPPHKRPVLPPYVTKTVQTWPDVPMEVVETPRECHGVSDVHTPVLAK